MAKLNPNLRDVVLVKNAAGAIAKHGQVKAGQGDELVRAYERARAQAEALVARAWPEDAAHFASEYPKAISIGTTAVIAGSVEAALGPRRLLDEIARGEAVKVLAAQLEAWAAGYQEVFETEQRLAADAEARTAAEAKNAERRRGVGFAAGSDSGA